MNYENKTDDEIELLVANKLGFEYELRPVHFNTGIDSSKHYWKDVIYRKLTENKKYWRPFNPCLDAGDAWPIIVKNSISLNSLDDYNDEIGEYKINGKWQALAISNEDGFHFKDSECFHFIDENPLRAAMIVFLMIKESE